MAVTQTVTGPTRSPRLAGLSSVAEFEPTDRLGYTEQVSWIGDPCTFPKSAIGLCFETPDPEGADAKTGVGIDIETAIGAPFALYGGVECYLGPDGDFDERARAILDQGMDRALEARVVAWANGGTALAGATSLLDALALVENEIDEVYAGRGIILVNRGDALRLEGPLSRVGDTITTINGTPVVSTSAVPAGTVLGVGAIKVLQTPILAHNVIAHTTNLEFSIAERVNAILVDCSFRVLATVTA